MGGVQGRERARRPPCVAGCRVKRLQTQPFGSEARPFQSVTWRGADEAASHGNAILETPGKRRRAIASPDANRREKQVEHPPLMPPRASRPEL
jgi:hypothetical protein